MATRTLSARRRVPAWRSSIVLKALMAVSGLVLIGYLLAHMYGNLKVFSGQGAFDDYAHHLRTLGEPYLPFAGALWIIRFVLLGAIAVHIAAAVTLWRRARHATSGKGGSRYESMSAPRGAQRTYASYTLRWGGVTILLFVIYHLLHLTWNTIHPGGASDSPFERVVNGFGIWWVVLSYTVAMIALALHLRHGIWSAMATLGLNTSVKRRKQLNGVAVLGAAVITIGFLLPPYAILLGWVS